MNHSNIPGAFEHLDVPVYNSPQKEIDSIFQATMQKAKLPIVARKPRRRMILTAAVIATGILSVAASYLSVSDIFRGYLNEYSGAESSARLSSLSNIVDQTGTILDVASSSVNGIKVTPRAIAGDDSTFLILFELETVDGTPLGIELGDGSVSDGIMRFIRASFSLDHQKIGRVFSEGMDFAANGSSGTILQRFNLYEPVPMGESLHITFDGLQQRASLPGEEIGLGRDMLGDVVSGFQREHSSDKLVSAHTLEPGGAGVSSTFFDDDILALGQDGSSTLPLNGPLDGYTLTNAVLQDGWLYLRGYAPLDTNLTNDLRNSALVSSTGSAIEVSYIHFGNRDDSSVMPWGLAFEGINTMDELADLSLVVNYGETFHPYVDGNWSFDIPLGYDSASQEHTPNTDMEINGIGGTLTKLVISPYRITFDFLPKSDTMEAIEQTWADPYPEVCLKTVDGDNIIPDIESFTEIDQSDGTTLIRGFYYLNDIIDPGQVEAFYFGNSVYAIN